MPDTTPNLLLPVLLPSQAQKHVTHNEALVLLDALCQLAVTSRDLVDPPSGAADGDCHIVPASASGDWAGQDGSVAIRTNGGWVFRVPRTGWQAYVIPEGVTVAFDGTSWTAVQTELSGTGHDDLERLGINASADAANRFAVASDGSLFTHDGAGHRIAVNKAAAGDTASLLFQSGWTGHAELGLAGDTDFAIKVSADGSSWLTALTADPAGQELRIDFPVTGAAVQQDELDSTGGRLLRTGAFGLGTETPNILPDLNATETPVGFYRVWPSTLGQRPAGTGIYGFVSVQRINGANLSQTFWDTVSDGTWTRRYRSGAWQPWRPIHTEEGTNANGSYSRSGPTGQVCWIDAVPSGTIEQSHGALFQGPDCTWTFPASFAQPPVVLGSCEGASAWVVCDTATTSGVTVRAVSALQSATSRTIKLVAIGHWT